MYSGRNKSKRSRNISVLEFPGLNTVIFTKCLSVENTSAEISLLDQFSPNLELAYQLGHYRCTRRMLNSFENPSQFWPEKSKITVLLFIVFNDNGFEQKQPLRLHIP